MSFASSAGWNDTAPSRIQRRVPLMAWPMGGMSTSTSKPADTIRSGSTSPSSRR